MLKQAWKLGGSSKKTELFSARDGVGTLLSALNPGLCLLQPCCPGDSDGQTGAGGHCQSTSLPPQSALSLSQGIIPGPQAISSSLWGLTPLTPSLNLQPCTALSPLPNLVVSTHQKNVLHWIGCSALQSSSTLRPIWWGGPSLHIVDAHRRVRAEAVPSLPNGKNEFHIIPGLSHERGGGFLVRQDDKSHVHFNKEPWTAFRPS